MTDESKSVEIIPGFHQEVEVTTSSTEITYKWSASQSKHEILISYDIKNHLLTIYPKTRSTNGFIEQFSQIEKIIIDTRYIDWSPDNAVGDEERTNHLELPNLPAGFGTVFAYGLGVRRSYRKLIHRIETVSNCTIVRFGGDGDEGEKNGTFRISLSRFARHVQEVDLHRDRATTVLGRINDAGAHNLLAEVSGDARVEVNLGRLGDIQAMTRAISDQTPLTSREQSALVVRMAEEAKEIATAKPESLGKLREDLNLVTLEVLIQNFEKNLKGKTAASEPVWQEFFKQNSFALKEIFASPVALYGDQLHVRVPDMDGVSGRIADFVLQNTLTDSTVVVEIKTPSAELVEKNSYRGKSGAVVHSPSKHLSGGIAQLQAQIESVRSDFSNIIRQKPGGKIIDTRFVRGAVIVGMLTTLEGLKRESFVRYRDGLANVEVITFDEVLDRLRALHEMLVGVQSEEARSDGVGTAG